MPKTLDKNTFALTGSWTIGAERSMPMTGATLSYNFDAGEVFLVMRPKTLGVTGMMNVYLDGTLLTTQNAGDDTKGGTVKINGDRLYKLIKLKTPGPHILKLEFLDNNIELYAFTFG